IPREIQAHNRRVVVDHDDSPTVRFNASALVFRRSVVFFWAWRFLALAPMRAIGEHVYAWVARNRGELGRWSAVALPYRNRAIAPTITLQVVVALLMVPGLVISLQSIHVVIPRVVDIADSVGQSVRLGQGWTMFAPQPS